MGTNASNKSVASKIVAVLLAALMLISVMPMSAFAATAANIVVEGLTVYNDGDFEMAYNDGDEFTFDGLIIEVTYRSLSEIEAEGADKASRATALIKGYNKTEWTRYGIGSNYTEGQTLTVADNLKPLEFTFGANSSLTLETDIYVAVFPTGWAYAELVKGFYVDDTNDAAGSNEFAGADKADGDYVLVANGDTLVSSVLADEDHVDAQLAQYSLAAFEGIKVDGKSVANLTKQLLDLEVDYEDVVWEIKDETVAFDADNQYVLTFANVDGLYIDIAAAQDNKQIRDNEWPLSVSKTGKSAKNVAWTLTDVEDGNLYTTTTVKGKTYYDAELGKDVTADVEVKLYIAINEAGYVYLTDVAADAAKISVYRVGDTDAYVNDIEIAQNPDKMAYVEGENFDGEGMIVNLMYNDNVVACIPYALFDVYGIAVWPYVGNYDVNPADNDVMTVKDHNDKAIWVYYYDEYCDDDSDVKLSVSKADAFDYTLVDGKLTDGTYAIVWIDSETDKLAKNTGYDGYALASDIVAGDKAGVWGMDGSSYSLSTTGSAWVDIYNDVITWASSNNIKWNVKYNATERAFTIQDAATGKYLSRNTLTYKDLWVFELNPGNTVEDSEITTEYIIDNLKTLALTTECTADSYWLIDGSFDAAIESSADENDNYYLLTTGFASFAADMSMMSDADMDNYYFFKVADFEITALEIADQPKASYESGEALDLHDMVVKATYTDGTKVLIAYDDLASYGITVNYADGALLSGSDNGKTVTVTLGNLTASTVTLTVADSKKDAAIVRLGGADRYETATIIANSYVTALGTAYENVAVLTSGVNYPDALAGATLATALKAPIVLTKAETLVETTKTFLTANAVKTVYVIGGTSAVSADVEATLKAMDITVVRIAGTDRVETSVAVAKKLAEIKGAADTVILTNGSNFADALSVSSAAAQLGLPVVYVNGTISETVKTFITESKATKAIILGGESAVSADTEKAVAAMGLSVERIAGADRYETSTAIAEYFADCYTGAAVTFATGKDFPDALAGGVYAAYVGAPVVLLDNGYANADAALYTAGLDLTNVYVFGGTAALSDATINAALLK